MKFAVIGGDKRSCIMCSLLRSDGHRVNTFALEKAALGADVVRVGCLQGAVYGADCVILPLPSVRGGNVNAPFSEEKLAFSALVQSLWRDQLIVGGAFSAEDIALLKSEGLHAADIMTAGDFVMKNAALTAEGAVALMMENGERALRGSDVLVLGWGRIGKLLCRSLRGLGAYVTVAERNEEARTMAQLQGLRVCCFEDIPLCGHTYDFVVNTVPGIVLDSLALSSFSDRALIVELARGFDASLAAELGLMVIAAPGLPGKYSPYSAALLMREAVYKAVSDI